MNALIDALCPAVTRTLDDPSNLSLSVVFAVFDESTKFASGPGFGFLDHAPELKSLGIDCFLDRSAMEVAFFITEDALKCVEPQMRFDEAGLLRAFDSHRDLICATAAKVYKRRRKGSYDLVGSDF